MYIQASGIKQGKELFNKQDKSLQVLICRWQVAFIQKLNLCNSE